MHIGITHLYVHNFFQPKDILFYFFTFLTFFSFALMKSFEERLEHLIHEALLEDVRDGDHSTLSCIPAGKKGKAVLKIKQDGILAGMEVAHKILAFINPGLQFKPFMKDGEVMRNGDEAFEVEAAIHNILKCERLV